MPLFKRAPKPRAAVSAPESTQPYRNGAVLEVTRGEAHQDTKGQDGTPGGGTTRMGGKRVKVDGPAYVAEAGPNRGKECQQVKDPQTGRLYAVPTDRLKNVQGGHAGSKVGWTPGYDEAYRRAFGHD